MTFFQILNILSASLAVILVFLLASFNKFVRLRNRVKTDFSDIEIQLRRRASLIQNLVDLIREYATHEKNTFSDVTKARSALDNSKTTHETAQASNMLTETLRSLMMVTEAYPELKASDNYKQTHKDLLETENLVAQYRETYNKSVEFFNNTIQTFPNLLIAGLFGFESEELFQQMNASDTTVSKK